MRGANVQHGDDDSGWQNTELCHFAGKIKTQQKIVKNIETV